METAMLKHLAVLFAVLPGGALADAAPEKPSAAGQPHVCTPYYPQAAVKAGAEGVTTTSFTITAQGRVVNPSIRTSSGNADLDAASLTCVSTWTYKPATMNGVAVETPWLASVQWKLDAAQNYQLVAVCDTYHALSEQMLAGIGGVTGLTLRVMPDGTVSQAAVSLSSGDPGLDDAAVRCLSDQRYAPVAMKVPADGLPMHAQVDWRAQLGASVPLAPPFPHEFVPPGIVGVHGPCFDQLHSRNDLPPSPRPTTLGFTIAADGRVKDETIKHSSGSEPLDKAALSCAAKWRYIPALLNAKPQAVFWTANVDWKPR
jgi:TonB family protein